MLILSQVFTLESDHYKVDVHWPRKHDRAGDEGDHGMRDHWPIVDKSSFYL